MWRARCAAMVIACVAVAAPPAMASPTLVAAGDIACPPGTPSTPVSCQYAATATLIQALAPDAVASLGDTQYENGTAAEFSAFDGTWGQFKSLIHPVIGNHEYGTPGGTGYFGYFGAAAGDPAKGYYSYDLGTWHLVALNSNCDQIDCAAETQWLRDDLAAHPAACTLAYWHHPLFTSGPTSGQPDNLASKQFWQVLYTSHADVVLNGHDHDYERFAPQTPDGVADDAHGIRELVAGTGGDDFYTLGPVFAANSEQHYSGFGALSMTLDPGGYTWSFHPTSGSFSDTGSGVCDGAGAPVTDGGGTGSATVPATVPPPAAPATPGAGGRRGAGARRAVTLTLRVHRQSLRSALAKGLRVVLTPSASGRVSLVVRGHGGRIVGRRRGSLRRTVPTAMFIRLSAVRAARLMHRGTVRLRVQARLSVAGAGRFGAGRSLSLRH